MNSIPLRNVTKQAIELAKRAMVEEQPSLAYSEVRQTLPNILKKITIQKLINYAEYFEQKLIDQIKYKHGTD